MAPRDSAIPEASPTGGTYDVKDDGIHFRHAPSIPSTDANGAPPILPPDFSIRVLDRPTPNDLVFEMTGVDVSFANALRRIMIAEIPTVALEHVYMWNNSGLVHDEVLSHRLGLVPLNVDPRLFDEWGLDLDENGEEAATDRNTVVFHMLAQCGKDERDDKRMQKKTDSKHKSEGLIGGKDVEKKKDDAGDDVDDGNEHTELGDVVDADYEEPAVVVQPLADKAAADAAALHRTVKSSSGGGERGSAPDASSTPIDAPHRPFTKHVYASDLLWAPQGDQLKRFPIKEGGGGGIRPIHEDILLAKLRPGQVIELEAHARKGVGADHAKFSPVATAAYRLMPHVEIVKPVYDDLAEELVNWLEPGVFELIPASVGEGDPPGTKLKAKVKNPYACTMSRNFLRNPALAEAVKMTRIPNHYIFSIESVGMMSPSVIVAEALKVLKEKSERVSALADESSMGVTEE